MPKQFRLTTLMCGLLTAGLLFLASARQAEARKPYLGYFVKAYPEVAKNNDVAKTVKCNVCHIKKKSKKMRNAFGKALKKALGEIGVKKNAKKKQFDEALKKVAQEKSEEGNKTFGELLDAGELPAKK